MNIYPAPPASTPETALDRLREGNQRFTSGMRSVEPLLSHLRMRELAANGQRPFAIVLTCSDSRSPAEMIFDQGIGDLFVIRVAGNVVAPSLLASIEFAASKFASSIVLVLGHTQCGAIGATVEYERDRTQALASPHLEELVGRILPAVARAVRECPINHEDIFAHATRENVFRSMKLIQSQSEIVRDLVTAGTLAVAGAILDISTGQVDFFKT